MPGYLLEHTRAMGDVLVMSALVRDLYLSTGADIAVKTSVPQIWDASPYCRIAGVNEPELQHVKLDYGPSLNIS